jgi:hypothetical protein
MNQMRKIFNIISGVVLILSMIMAGIAAVSGLLVIVVSLIWGKEVGLEMLRMMLLC